LYFKIRVSDSEVCAVLLESNLGDKGQNNQPFSNPHFIVGAKGLCGWYAGLNGFTSRSSQAPEILSQLALAIEFLPGFPWASLAAV
jgi:hypothetical protein